MSLVLAIQPDRDQAARLAAVCRRIGTDLVLAPSAPEALAALGSRVPDLVLSAPLISAHDEAAVSDRLRELGPAALHVQSITAPLLGDRVEEPPRPRGFFAALRLRRPDVTVPATCDPNAFAEQISGYLLRAIAERAALDADAPQAHISVDEPWYLVGAGGADGWTAAGALSDAGPPRGDRQAVENVAAPVDRSVAPAHEQPLVIPATELELTRFLGALEMPGAVHPRRQPAPSRPPRQRRPKRATHSVMLDAAAYFDPARCTFAALVAAFDAVATTEPGMAAAARRW